jgi:hypothetical protein
VLVLAAGAIAALAVALAVPGARSEILRAFHLEGVTIERVDQLPPAQERPLSASLGRPVSRAVAGRALGRPVALPPLAAPPRLHERRGAVSLLLALPEPVLLSELRTGGGPPIVQKLVGASTGILRVRVGGAAGFWISGAEHLYLVPAAPPRLAGNVLIWETGGIVYRIEGRALTEQDAMRLAGELGT